MWRVVRWCAVPIMPSVTYRGNSSDSLLMAIMSGSVSDGAEITGEGGSSVCAFEDNHLGACKWPIINALKRSL